MYNVISRIFGSTEMQAMYGRGIQYLSQFVMVLVVPKVLSPELYVELNLVLPLAFLGVSLLFGWMMGSIHRHVHEFLDGKEIEVRQTVFTYFSAISIAGLLIFAALFPLLDSVYRLIPLLLVAAAHKNLLIGILNLSGNNKGYMLANLGFAASLALFVLLCYLRPGEGLAGKLVIYGAVDIIVGLVVWYKLGLDGYGLRPRFHKAIASRYMRYGMPLVLNGLATWVVSVSDRYILSIWEKPVTVASYILNYQLGGSVVVIPMSFAVAVYLQKILRIDKDQGLEAALDYTYGLLKIYKKFFLLFLVVGFSIVLSLKYFVYSEYEFNYGKTLFVLVLAHLVLGFTHFYNKEFELNGRTYIISKSIGLGAVVNAICNFSLIPVIGSLGAAFSTLIAYTVTVLVVYKSREYRPK